jgi:hypothetical protein
MPDDCFETLLKTLKGFKDSQKEKDSITIQDTQKIGCTAVNQMGVGTVQQGAWNLERLLEKVSPKRRITLLEQEKRAVPVLSWILYGVANSSIQDPLGLAVSKLSDQPGMSAGGAFDRLANLPPEQLVQLVQMERSMRYPSNRDWRLVMKSIPVERVVLLSDLLGIQVEEEEARM